MVDDETPYEVTKEEIIGQKVQAFVLDNVYADLILARYASVD